MDQDSRDLVEQFMRGHLQGVIIIAPAFHPRVGKDSRNIVKLFMRGSSKESLLPFAREWKRTAEIS